MGLQWSSTDGMLLLRSAAGGRCAQGAGLAFACACSLMRMLPDDPLQTGPVLQLSCDPLPVREGGWCWWCAVAAGPAAAQSVVCSWHPACLLCVHLPVGTSLLHPLISVLHTRRVSMRRGTSLTRSRGTRWAAWWAAPCTQVRSRPLLCIAPAAAAAVVGCIAPAAPAAAPDAPAAAVGHAPCLPCTPPCSCAGLIFTAGTIWNILQKLNIPIHVQEVGALGAGVPNQCQQAAALGLALCASCCRPCGCLCSIKNLQGSLLSASHVPLPLCPSPAFLPLHRCACSPPLCSPPSAPSPPTCS